MQNPNANTPRDMIRLAQQRGSLLLTFATPDDASWFRAELYKVNDGVHIHYVPLHQLYLANDNSLPAHIRKLL